MPRRTSPRVVTRPRAAVATLFAVLMLCASGTVVAADPPLPAPGQTVIWTEGMSPLSFDGQLTIPAGGSVVVEAGATLDFANLSRLFVEGSLSAEGTAADPVLITGQPSGWLVARGHVELRHCTIDNTLAQGTDSRLEVFDSVFTPDAHVLTDIISGPVRARLERCVVQAPQFRVVGEVLVRDLELQGSAAELAGYVQLEGVQGQGSSLNVFRQLQHTLIEDVDLQGAPGPALVLDGGSDFFIDASVSLSGNAWPLQTKGSGLRPGSVLPTSGNQNDAILGFEGNTIHRGAVTVPDLGLPYVILEDPEFSGAFDVEPGVRFEMGTSGRILLRGDSFHHGLDLRGLPGKPITLRPRVPGDTWFALGGVGGTYLFEHLEIEGAGNGVAAPQSQIYVSESVLRACVQGMEPSGLGHITVSGTRFLDNGVGASGDTSVASAGGLSLGGAARPNVFAGNELAVRKGNGASGTIPAEFNWWNDPSGPQSSANPGGQGDPLGFGVDAQPFLTAEPDLSDTPPVVRVQDPFFLADPGETLLIQWTVDDDVEVVSQEILLDLSGGGNLSFQTLASVSGDTTQYAFVMPEPGYNTAARPALLRVRATDSAGQTSFDEVALHVSSAPYAGSFAFTSDLSATFEPLERFPICWEAFGVAGSLRAYLVLDADERIDLGPAGSSGASCSTTFVVPYVSTDSARIAVKANGQGNIDEWFFSEPFSIRPDAMFGDAAPQVTLLTPVAGQQVGAGELLDVTWTASDDDPLRAFHVLLSLDAGRTWNAVARELPGTSTSFAWQVPQGIDVADARVRVVAVDRRFQNSSDGAQTAFEIRPESVWRDLGLGLAGSAGTPQLVGSGSQQVGAPTSLTLSGGLPGASSTLVLGLSQLAAPFKGGVMLPNPDVLRHGLLLDAGGGVSFGFAWPAGVPAGLPLYWQQWIVDAGGVSGFAATNALSSVAP